jgi:CDP-glucose 4,6-dehydratase
MNQTTKENFLDCFRNKKVLITGHTGFKGSWLTYVLVEAGADVMGYSLPPSTQPNHFDLLDLESRIHHITGDIRDADMFNRYIEEFQPEFVFHLAAQALVRVSYIDPIETFSTNVLGSAVVLDAVRRCESIRSFIFVTSDKCYENLEWNWGYRENDKLGGNDPYSASKAAAEILFNSFEKSYYCQIKKLGAVSVRAGNVIGGGDWAKDRIVPDCIKSIIEENPLLIRNPHSTRPWQHVLEPIGGYLMLASKLYSDPKRFTGSWNFGPSPREVRNVFEVATFLIDRIGSGSIRVENSEKNPQEASLLQLNCEKANQLLGWYPRWDVNTTLENTADWFKSFFENNDAKEITKIQTYSYFTELK